MVAKENPGFKKKNPLCDPGEKHWVEIAASYQNDVDCVLFVEIIAADVQDKLTGKLNNTKFFSSCRKAAKL